jgi:hypothetical protein
MVGQMEDFTSSRTFRVAAFARAAHSLPRPRSISPRSGAGGAGTAGFFDGQSCAVQSVDQAVERQQAIIEGMELVNIRDAPGRKMNGIGWFKSGVTG